MSRHVLQHRILASGAGIALCVGLAFWLRRVLDAETLTAWRAHASPGPFFLAQALLPLVGVPTTPFFVMAGASFGPLTAVVGSVAGVALNLAMSHWIIASGLRPIIVRLLARGRYRLPDIGPDHGARFTLVVRLFPAMPSFVKSYLLCLAGVPFSVFFSISMVTSTLYAISFVLLGGSIFEQDVRILVSAVAGVVLFWGGARLLLRRLLASRRTAPSPSDEID